MSGDVSDIQLHLAARTGNIIAVSHFLNNKSNPNAVLKRNLYPEELIKNFKVDFWTPLHCAVDAQNEKIVKLLIKYEANLNSEDEYGRTPLNLAASRGNLKIVKLLLDSGAHVDGSVDDAKGQSEKPKSRIREPLHAAVESNSFAIVKLLIENDSNLNLEDRWNRTPLCLSILEGNSQIVELLLENGADVKKSMDSTDKRCGKTALHHVAEKLQVKIMKMLSANYDSKFNETQKILNLCFYRNYNDSNCLDSKSQNVIQIIEEHDKIVRTILKFDYNIDAVDVDGWSALHLACKEGNWKIAKTLLENGADVDLREKSGRTALHLALMYRRRAIIEILLDYEANFLISDNEGLTPLNYQGQFCPEFDFEAHVVKVEILKITEKEYLMQHVLSHFERSCFEEIFHLKVESIKFGFSSFTLYHIFTDESYRKLIRLCKNEEFCNKTLSENFYKKFPIYGDILKGRLEKAIRKKRLMDEGLEALNYILNIDLPDFILEDILSYLSNADIVNLIKLYEIME